jgi:hypothetical protein
MHKEAETARETGAKFLKFLSTTIRLYFSNKQWYNTPGTRSGGGGIKMLTHFYGARGSGVNKCSAKAGNMSVFYTCAPPHDNGKAPVVRGITSACTDRVQKFPSRTGCNTASCILLCFVIILNYSGSLSFGKNLLRLF